jgi:release factor-specific protein-(glutamine-N5) methyltransferase
VKKSEKSGVCVRSNIGGQAVLEGVMMRGKTAVATAVRAPSGDITVESIRLKPQSKARKIPIVRGVLAFFDSLIFGTKILMNSAEVYGDFGESGKFALWLEKKFKIDAANLVMGVSVVLGLAFAIVLFTIIPGLIVNALDNIPSFFALNNREIIKSLIQGGLKLLIFVLYILAVSKVKDIDRLFRYHGAEHKTISCFERGLELTVENARTMPTAHSRCGTSFMFIVMAVSIVILSFVSFLVYGVLGFQASGANAKLINGLVRIGISLAILPFVAGIAYEFLKLFSKSDNVLFRIFRAPGMLLQKLTTKEPDDGMIEVAIKAFTTVREMEADPSIPEQKFDIKIPLDYLRRQIMRDLGDNAEVSDADWILAEVAGVGRSGLAALDGVKKEAAERARELAKKRATGEPLQYILGYAEFYGIKLAVNSAVLIPRPETELLAEQVILAAKEGSSVLDIGTGSGAIAIAAAKNAPVKVTATDISPSALAVAKANAQACGAEVEFISGDMLEAVKGRKFDIIVSNPPYIPSADIEKLDKTVKDFEPRGALDGGADGLKYYKVLAKEAHALLNPNGVILLEVGINQAESVKELFKDALNAETIYDYNGVARILKIFY